MRIYLFLVTSVLYAPLSLAQPEITNKNNVTVNKHKNQQPVTNDKVSSVLFPTDQLYTEYIANPLRSTFSAQTLFFDKTSIANTSLRRFSLKVGGRLGIYRRIYSQFAWQITLNGGFHGQFDAEQSQDNIGWDGLYGMSFDIRTSDSLAYRLAVHHTSSHIGDEIAERTGRKRINYTRQETRAGIMWTFIPKWTSYAEIAYGHDLREKSLQRPWRAELGLQHEKPQYFSEQIGWYMALDLSSYEESNWDINTTVQMGIVSTLNKRKWRFGFEYYDGRAQLGEFFQDTERYIGIGLWIDI